LLVRFSEAAQPSMFVGPAAALANGADLRFTKTDGTTDLPFQTESWTAGPGGAGAVWVLLDSVPPDQDPAYAFRVYWRKPGSSTMSNPKATFDTADGYQAVFHLSTTSAHDTDAANGYLGARTGTSTTAGLIGNALTFGTRDSTYATNYLTFQPDSSSPLGRLAGDITMEAWGLTSISDTVDTSRRTIIDCGYRTYIRYPSFYYTSTTWMERSGSVPNTYVAGGIGGPEVPPGESTAWTYISAVFDSALWTIYRQRSTDPWGTATPKVTAAGPGPRGYYHVNATSVTAMCGPWTLGASQASNPWLGKLDEIRISTIARDSNYMRLNFETQKGTATAVTVGPDVVVGILAGSSSTSRTTVSKVRLVLGADGGLLLERKTPDGRALHYTLDGQSYRLAP
jgi:hypothetical protein